MPPSARRRVSQAVGNRLCQRRAAMSGRDVVSEVSGDICRWRSPIGRAWDRIGPGCSVKSCPRPLTPAPLHVLAGAAMPGHLAGCPRRPSGFGDVARLTSLCFARAMPRRPGGDPRRHGGHRLTVHGKPATTLIVSRSRCRSPSPAHDEDGKPGTPPDRRRGRQVCVPRPDANLFRRAGT